MIEPPSSVLRAWDVSDPRPLAGGQGTAFACGDVVLKPVLDEREAVWLAEVLGSLTVLDHLRIIRPVASVSGAWVIDGWSAWERLDGEVVGGRWREVLEVSRDFHAAVADVAWSDAIARDHPWAIGADWAWGEGELDVPPAMADVVAALDDRCRPIALGSQLVHTDLCNNVLFADDLPPAVIDVSPQWRPARWADAIIVADSIGWFGADASAIEPLADEEGVQLLVRALRFRLGSAVLHFPDQPGRLAPETAPYERVLAMLPR